MGNKAKTTEQFIQEGIALYGDKYSYPNTIYRKNNEDVEIECAIHGAFSIRPLNFLQGHGCPKCKSDKLKSLVMGIGVNDANCCHSELSYREWVRVLNRCYAKRIHQINPTYINCSVCEEWLTFSNFKRWFVENYVEGYQLDKDILVKGNRIYSPDTCCFVPKEINVLFCKCDKRRGNLPIGVSIKPKKAHHKYYAQINLFGKNTFLKYCETPEEAFGVYKQAKEAHLKNIAQQYFEAGAISKNVYEALMRYEVEITD